MQRYFVPDKQLENDSVSIIGNDAHHISNVLRMKEGDRIQCVFGEGRSALVEITGFTTEQINGTVIEWMSEEKEMPVSVTIVSGLPKGDKLEYIIQKGTELGAYSFIPFAAERSIVKWDVKKAGKKLERLRKIAKEAAEQSHRTIVPYIDEPIKLSALLAKAREYDVCLIAYEEEAKQDEKSVFRAALQELKPGEKVMIVFGPEGGLTDSEVGQLKGAGFIACGLGPRILRTETAPLYALAAVSYQVELMG
ncbi:MAG: 16S rRNA (uracil(1498)-N(3))-methyltransferase [Bacillus sp. (in: firmicutes)]